MLTDFTHVIMIFFILVNVASAAYMLLAITSVYAFSASSPDPVSGGFQPQLTIMKPVCGLDADLYDNLRSYCLQDYPDYQIVYGVHDPDDAAVPVIRRLMDEFPQVDMELAINKDTCGSNLKVSNLYNMYDKVKYPYLVIADSDTRVEPDYLSTIIAPFEDAKVGLVTCLYRGIPTGGLASLLSSMFINESFLPSVLVSARIREIKFALGATMVVRRGLLDDIGGFGRLSDNIADDYLLGNLVGEYGYKVVLSDYVVENIIFEQNLFTMFAHELRWTRTVRSVEPVGHAFSFVTYVVPTALIAAATVGLVTDYWLLASAMVLLAIALRLLMHFTVHGMLGTKPGYRSLVLVPFRDILGFIVWGTGFFSRRVDWRGTVFSIGKGGLVTTTTERPE